MTDTDHDKIIRMEEKINTVEKKLDELCSNFSTFKREHDEFRKEIVDLIKEGMNDAKKSAVSYADNAVISKFRDEGTYIFAEKRVQTVVYGAVKIILIAFIGGILTIMGFQLYG